MFRTQILLTPAAATLGLFFLLSSAMRHYDNTKYEQIAFGGVGTAAGLIGLVLAFVLARV